MKEIFCEYSIYLTFLNEAINFSSSIKLMV